MKQTAKLLALVLALVMILGVFAACGNHVEQLMRISLGGLVMPEKLAIGACMELLHKDVENLFRPIEFESFCAEFSGFFSAILINNQL